MKKFVAIADGYYGSQIIKDGQTFDFKGPYKKDKEGKLTVLPLWVKEIGEKKEYVAPTPPNPLTADSGDDQVASASDIFGSDDAPSLTDLV